MLEFLAAAFLLGLLPAMIANSKGHGFFGWYVYGVLLFIVALVHALILKSPTQKAMEQRLASGGVSDAEELERFAKLREQGVISDAEFETKKRALLSR